MTTTVVSTIGTGGTYTTLAAWWAACPIDLTAVDQIWRGELLNQEFVSSGTALTISGKTTDATRYVELTVAAGASYADNANKATNALRYNAANGAAIRNTGGSITVLVQQQYTRISRLQIASAFSGTGALSTVVVSGGATKGVDINQCIIEGYAEPSSGFASVLSLSGSSSATGTDFGVVRNTAVVQKSAFTASFIARMDNNVAAYNCTFVALGATVTYGINVTNAGGILHNSYVGGVVTPHDANGVLTKTSCYSNVAAAGFTVAPLSTATFANVTSGTHDLRLVTGSALIDAGTANTTYAATGILGTTRPQGASYDVGAYEFPAAPPATLNLGIINIAGGAALSSPAITSAAPVAGVVNLAVVSIAGGAALSSPAISTTQVLGTLTSDPFKAWGLPAALASLTVPRVVVLKLDGTVVLNLTNQVTNGAGCLVLTSALLVAGTVYMLGTWDPASPLTSRGLKAYTAA